jgi:adenylate kinase family enzyme
MKRAIVIGSGGAGKSTFARSLSGRTGLPVVHLDKLFWRPGWQPTPKEEWAEKVRLEIEKPEWIMDGNFGGTRLMRMQAADTIIFLDLPRWQCLWRIVKRRLTHSGRNRPDMAEGCNEKLDLEFIIWVWNYPKLSRARALEEISSLKGKHLVILRSQADINRFLEEPHAA